MKDLSETRHDAHVKAYRNSQIFKQKVRLLTELAMHQHFQDLRLNGLSLRAKKTGSAWTWRNRLAWVVLKILSLWD